MADNEYVIHIAGMTKEPRVRLDSGGAWSLARAIVDAINDGKEVRIKYTWPDPDLAGHGPSLDEQHFMHHFIEEAGDISPEAVAWLRKRAAPMDIGSRWQDGPSRTCPAGQYGSLSNNLPVTSAKA
jgi:hypothetical protein